MSSTPTAIPSSSSTTFGTLSDIDLLTVDHVCLALQRRGALSPHRIARLAADAARRHAPPSHTALELFVDEQRDTQSSQQQVSPPPVYLLDYQHRSTALTPQLVIELCGEAGSGKTQCCLTAAVDAVVTGGEVSVLYIDTEKSFSAERLLEIGTTRYPDWCRSRANILRLATRVYVRVELSCEALLQRLNDLDADIVALKVCLVIVDSIAAHTRIEFNDIVKRQQYLTQVASCLKSIADMFHIPVLATNQVMSSGFNTSRSLDVATAVSRKLQVALGLKWFHAVNVRFVLSVLDHTRRQLLLIKSPSEPNISINFEVCQAGCIAAADDVIDEDDGVDDDHMLNMYQ